MEPKISMLSEKKFSLYKEKKTLHFFLKYGVRLCM